MAEALATSPGEAAATAAAAAPHIFGRHASMRVSLTLPNETPEPTTPTRTHRASAPGSTIHALSRSTSLHTSSSTGTVSHSASKSTSPSFAEDCDEFSNSMALSNGGGSLTSISACRVDKLPPRSFSDAISGKSNKMKLLASKLFGSRSKSDKGGDKWTAMMALLRRKHYVPPAYASFVSRQLHKYLTTVKPECNETATGFQLTGAVLFSDASGFTALTERLASQENGEHGAEQLSEIINRFFDKLIDIVDKYAGDIVKFAGDAVCIVWAVDPAEAVSSHGYISPNLSIATLRACACSIELHQALHDYVAIDDPNPENRVLLQLHMGLGCGQLTAVHVGGVFHRWEYILAGSPMAQIAVAEPKAQRGETVLSPQAWTEVRGHITATSLALRAEEPHPKLHDYGVLVSVDVDVPIPMFPTQLPITEEVRDLMKRYIPKAVLPKLDNGQNGHLAELREVSVMFVNVQGVELGAATAEHVSESVRIGQMLMLEIQRTVYSHEGSINKMLVDDKGLLVLCVWGLPPMSHSDDPIRAVASALDAVENLKRLGAGVRARVGVASGRAFCGVVGSLTRREYTVMGDCVNLSARLMAAVDGEGVIVDENTQHMCRKMRSNPFSFNPLEHKLHLKGKKDLATGYHPSMTPSAGPLVKSAITHKPSEDSFGRDNEITFLNIRLNELVIRKGGVMFVSGDRGSGKTCLVDNIVKSGEDAGLCVFVSSEKGATKYSGNAEGVLRDMQRMMATDDLVTTKLYMAWSTIFEDLIRTASSKDGTKPDEWVYKALASSPKYKENLTPYAYLLSTVISGLRQGSFTRRISASDRAGEQPTLIRDMLLRLLLTFADTTSLLIVLHLKTGTAATKIVDPESWMLAEHIGRVCIVREAEKAEHAIVLCVSTRPITRGQTDPEVNKVFQTAEKCKSVVQLRPLTLEGRDRYAANTLGVPLVAMPPILLQLLSDRAGGNPKHIQEMIQALRAPNAEAIRVMDNGRVEVVRLLDTVETPKKIVGAVKQEYDQLPLELQEVCRAAILLRSFTPCMVLELMQQGIEGEEPTRKPASATDSDVNGKLNLASVTQLFGDLIEYGIFEHTAQVATCVRKYYPRDFSSTSSLANLYQFVSRLLQGEIAQTQTEKWRSILDAALAKRNAVVERAFLCVLRFFRRARDRRIAMEQKRLFRAAYIIQTRFRKLQERRRSNTSVLSAQSTHSATHTLRVRASDLRMPSRSPALSSEPQTPPRSSTIRVIYDITNDKRNSLENVLATTLVVRAISAAMSEALNHHNRGSAASPPLSPSAMHAAIGLIPSIYSTDVTPIRANGSGGGNIDIDNGEANVDRDFDADDDLDANENQISNEIENGNNNDNDKDNMARIKVDNSNDHANANTPTAASTTTIVDEEDFTKAEELEEEEEEEQEEQHSSASPLTATRTNSSSKCSGMPEMPSTRASIDIGYVQDEVFCGTESPASTNHNHNNIMGTNNSVDTNNSVSVGNGNGNGNAPHVTFSLSQLLLSVGTTPTSHANMLSSTPIGDHTNANHTTTTTSAVLNNSNDDVSVSESPATPIGPLNVRLRRPSQPLPLPLSPRALTLSPLSCDHRPTSAPASMVRLPSPSTNISPARSFMTLSKTIVVRNTGRKLPEMSFPFNQDDTSHA